MMSPHEKKQLLVLIAKMPTTTPCNVCKNYDCGFCRIAGEKIPSDVAASGCELWVFDELSMPF